MKSALPPIKGYLPSTLIEWEGKLSSIVFLPTCNFRCPFCHASHLVLCPEKLETVPFEPIAAHLRENKGWIDGVVISGGEPTLHERLRGLIEAFRRLVPGVKLDTNGTAPGTVAALIRDGLVDCVAMDVKAPLGDAYERCTGVPVDCDAIQASIDLLRSCGVEHEFRTTVVPGLHTEEDIIEIARLLGPGEKLVLQQFAPLNCLDRRLMELEPYGRPAMRAMAAAASSHGATCVVRGERGDGKAKQGPSEERP